MFPDALIQPPLPRGPSPAQVPSAKLIGRAKSGDAAAQAEVRRAAQMLETHFVTWLLREMRKTVPDGGLIERGPAQDIYEQMLDDSLAESIAQGSGLGLAESITRQLLAQPPPRPASSGGDGPMPKPESGA